MNYLIICSVAPVLCALLAQQCQVFPFRTEFFFILSCFSSLLKSVFLHGMNMGYAIRYCIGTSVSIGSHKRAKNTDNYEFSESSKTVSEVPVFFNFALSCVI